MATLRTFGGLSVAEIAAASEVFGRTVKRAWRAAWAFLVSRLS